jgi:chloride channel protein, CIC family
MAHSERARGLNQFIQQSFLGKWAIIGLSIGIIAGIGATLFYFGIQLVTYAMLGGIAGFSPPNPNGETLLFSLAAVRPNFFLVPLSAALGGLISGIIVYTFAPEAEGHGTDEAIAAFHRKDGRIRRRIPVVKAIASAFTIGSGGSGGREGPTAQIAAGFGSFVGDLFRLSPRDRRIAVAVGIGAGIGTIFKSPFGGAILSGEILYSGGDFEVEALLPGFIASPIGYVIFASITGFTPIFGNSVTYVFTQPINLLIYAALGIICGLVGRLWTTSFYSARTFFASLRLPRFSRPMIGAGIAGVIAIFFPQVIGLGYGYLQYLIDAKTPSDIMAKISPNFFAIPLIATLVIIVLVKIVATSFTVGSGGSAGVFAPSLVIGGFVGATVWVITNMLLPGLIPIPAPVIIVGMVALFGGVGRVPIAVILMVSEMTGTLTLLVPSMVAVVVSYYVTGPKFTIYKSQVRTRSESPAHMGDYNVPLLMRVHVLDAMNPNVVAFEPSDSVRKAYEVMLDKGYRDIPVVDSGKLVGLATMSDLLRVPRENMESTQLTTVMNKNPTVAYSDESLREVLNKMTANRIDLLPVVSRESTQLLGVVGLTDAMRAYDRAVAALSKSEPTQRD